MADWDGVTSAGCTAGPIFAGAGNGWPHSALRRHIKLVRANQLPFLRL